MPTSGESFAPEATEEQKAQLRDSPVIAERFRRPAAPQGDTPRMPPENRSVGALTDDDLSSLAESGTFPQALSGKVGHPVHGDAAEERFNKIDTKFGRETFLHELRKRAIERQRSARGHAEAMRENKEIAKTWATEVAPRAAVFGIGATGGPAGAVLAGSAYEKAVPWIKEKYGDVEAFLARVERLEETENEVKNLRKELDALKPAQEFIERPDGSIDL